MGYRQQFFVAAKVDGKYRMLAVVHHQWIYGRTSLRQCLKTLNIFAAPGNLPGFRRELAQAAASKTNTSLIPATYPFTLTALIIGSSFHGEGHYSANVKPQKLDTAWNTFPNDDGIIVFDITDPSEPRYGYIWLGAAMPHARYASQLPLMTVMDAEEYIGGYYKAAEQSKYDVGGILAELKDFGIVDVAVLNELWPNRGFKGAAHQNAPTPDLAGLSLEDAGLEVVDAYLNGDTDEIPSLEKLILFREPIEERFASDPSLLSTVQGRKLFTRLADGTSNIDLTTFKDFDADQVVGVAKALASEETQENVTIWLPDHDGIQLTDLHTIAGTKEVAVLHLGRTKQVKLKDMLQNLFAGSNLVKLSTPLLFSRPMTLTFGPNEHLIRAQLRITEEFPCGTDTKFPVRQMVYLTSVTKSNAKRLGSGGLAWKQRTANSHYAALYLKDALLSTDDMVKKAPAAVARLATVQEWQLETQPMAKVLLGIAKMIAIDDSHRISPIPGMLYSNASNARFDSQRRLMHMMPLEVGGWTLLVLHERAVSSQGTANIRFAFINEHTTGRYNVLDAKTFLSNFSQNEALESLHAYWEQALSDLRSVMTTLKKAPEAEASTPPELAVVGRSSDSMAPETCRDAKFGVAHHEEVVQALEALEAMKDKPFNRFLEGLPDGASCQQN